MVKPVNKASLEASSLRFRLVEPSLLADDCSFNTSILSAPSQWRIAGF
jgi:hypothetical protein